jgi:hypothetical protein
MPAAAHHAATAEPAHEGQAGTASGLPGSQPAEEPAAPGTVNLRVALGPGVRPGITDLHAVTLDRADAAQACTDDAGQPLTWTEDRDGRMLAQDATGGRWTLIPTFAPWPAGGGGPGQCDASVNGGHRPAEIELTYWVPTRYMVRLPAADVEATLREAGFAGAAETAGKIARREITTGDAGEDEEDDPLGGLAGAIGKNARLFGADGPAGEPYGCDGAETFHVWLCHVSIG